MRSIDVAFDLRMNKRLGKQSRRRWFETPLRLLWRNCNFWLLVSVGAIWFLGSLATNISRTEESRPCSPDTSGLRPKYIFLVNSSKPVDTYRRQWTESTLVQVMVCRLFGTKPSLGLISVLLSTGNFESTSVKFKSNKKSPNQVEGREIRYCSGRGCPCSTWWRYCMHYIEIQFWGDKLIYMYKLLDSLHIYDVVYAL